MAIHNKNIFWVESIDHSEDWFIVAVDNIEAEKHFCSYNGYDVDLELVSAKIVCVAEYEDGEDVNETAYFPSHEMLLKNGFEIISEEEPRIFWKAGKKYCQGDIVRFSILYAHAKKQGVYIIEVRDSELFKIGVTKDLEKRLYQLQTSNPYEFFLIEFFVTDKNRELENLLHKRFKLNRYKREWFRLNPDEVMEACNFARNFIGKPYLKLPPELPENQTSYNLKNEKNDYPF